MIWVAAFPMKLVFALENNRCDDQSADVMEIGILS